MQIGSHSAGSAPRGVERRLATIMIADVFGYSRMMGENEERTVETLRGHRAVFDELLTAHRGRVFNTAGDSILAEFPSAVEAVRCATEIQTALRTRNEHLPDAQRMWFRIGINLGDVIVQGNDLLGDGVNVAARIQAVAEPGGVCISGSVYDQIQNKLTLQIKELGEKNFKNIAQPIRAFSISDEGGAPRPLGLRWRTMRKGPIMATAAAVLLLFCVGAAGYWLYLDYAVRAAEETRRTDEAKRATELQLKAEQEKAAAGSAQKEAKLLAELQSARDALAQAEASKRKAEVDRAAAEVAQREAKAQSDLKAAKDALQKAAESEKKAEQERKAASAAVASIAAAPSAQSAAPKIEAEATPANQVAQATRAEAARTTPATATGVNRHDGVYIGRVCRGDPDGTPRCWSVGLTIQHGALSMNWTTNYNQPVHGKGTIGTDGTVKVTLDSYKQNGQPLRGDMSGALAENKITVAGAWNNGMAITGTWLLNP